MGVTKIGFDVLDLTVRNLRLAGRPDLVRLGRQLNRNEDKLERVLQEVESLQDEVKRPSVKQRRRHEKPLDQRQVPGEVEVHMNPVAQLARTPAAAIEWFNILLTTGDAEIGTTPKDVVWTHRRTTLYRYRSDQRTQPVPVLLVFALINRPHIFDLARGNSFVEFLLDEGYDVFLLDWGEPGDEDGDLGLDDYVCDELPWGIRETLRAAEQEEVTLLGWCIGGTLCAMHAALEPDTPARNLALLTTPIDTTGSLYANGSGATRSTPSRSPTPTRDPGRVDRLRQQADEAGDQLLDHVPPALGRRARRQGPARLLPADGEMGGGQPAVPGPRVPRVGHLDVQGEPARGGPAAAARRDASTSARSSRTCSS